MRRATKTRPGEDAKYLATWRQRERQLLAGILKNPNLLDEASSLDDEDFVSGPHWSILRSLRCLRDEGNAWTADLLREESRSGACPHSPVTVKPLVDVIKERAQRRAERHQAAAEAEAEASRRTYDDAGAALDTELARVGITDVKDEVRKIKDLKKRKIAARVLDVVNASNRDLTSLDHVTEEAVEAEVETTRKLVESYFRVRIGNMGVHDGITETVRRDQEALDRQEAAGRVFTTKQTVAEAEKQRDLRRGNTKRGGLRTISNNGEVETASVADARAAWPDWWAKHRSSYATTTEACSALKKAFRVAISGDAIEKYLRRNSVIS